MRLFITGDIHGDLDYDKLERFKKHMNTELTLDDYIIICGDFGVIWDGGYRDNYMINTVYADFPCTILWVDGNHENFDLLNAYPVSEWNGGQVHMISDNIIHLMRGEVFTLGPKQTKIFVFGGARSVDRGYDTGKYCFWWPAELPTWREKQNAIQNLKMVNNEVDYVVTHDAPTSAIKKFMWYDSFKNIGFNQFLEDIKSKTDFKHWYFGHHHKDETIDKFTCLYESIVEIDNDNLLIRGNNI